MFTELIAAVDFDAVITAVGAVAAVIAGVLVARKGFRYVLGFIK